MEKLFSSVKIFINIILDCIQSIPILIGLFLISPFYCLKNFSLLKCWYYFKTLAPQRLLSLYLKSIFYYKQDIIWKSLRYLILAQNRLEIHLTNKTKLTKSQKAVFAHIYTLKAKLYFLSGSIDLGLETIIKGCKNLKLSRLPLFFDLDIKKSYIIKALIEAGDLLKDKIYADTAATILIHSHQDTLSIFNKDNNFSKNTTSKYKFSKTQPSNNSAKECKIIPFPQKFTRTKT